MIVFIEGPRHVGKTHLMESFFKRNENPDVMYYKFAFAKYIDELGMRDQETGPGVHYFSIANVMTILELNKTILKDKVLVFDRSIFSAYVWSIYRERMDKERLLNEFEKLLGSDLYQDCVLLYLTRSGDVNLEKREKSDYFGNFENYSAEESIFKEVLTRMNQYYSDSTRDNQYFEFINDFDEASTNRFCELITDLSSTKVLHNK
jgi:thymidylate kinase